MAETEAAHYCTTPKPISLLDSSLHLTLLGKLNSGVGQPFSLLDVSLQYVVLIRACLGTLPVPS